MKHEQCPTCGGSGLVPVTEVSAFKVGDRVVWDTGGWWGKKSATVVALSEARVKIKTDPHTQHNAGRHYLTYVSPKKLEMEVQP